MDYYKATRPDGTDFQTGTVHYGAALVSGEVIRHPAGTWNTTPNGKGSVVGWKPPKKVRDKPATYLSVSIAAADCTGAQWPCRLFRVEPVGRVMKNLSASPNKRAVSAMRVVEELPAHQSLGPNGEQVAAFIEGCNTLTASDWKEIDAARGAARGAAWDAALGAAWGAARGAAWDAALSAAWGAARGAARGAAWALTTRDLIADEQLDSLTQPFVDAGFASMVGR